MSTTPETAVTEAAAKAAAQARAEAEHEKEKRSVRWWVIITTLTCALMAILMLFLTIGIVIANVTHSTANVPIFSIIAAPVLFTASYIFRSIFLMDHAECVAAKP